MKWKYNQIYQFLVANICCFDSPLFTLSKNKTLATCHNWLLSNWSRLLIWKGPELSPSPLNRSKNFRIILSLLISFNWPSLVGYWVVIQKIYSKIHPISCTTTHHDVTDLVNHGMVKRWYIFRSYNFVAEVIRMPWVVKNRKIN